MSTYIFGDEKLVRIKNLESINFWNKYIFGDEKENNFT